LANTAVNAECRKYGVAQGTMTDQRYTPVRLSHLLRHCSAGAIVRGPAYLMVVRDIREWTDRSGQPGGRVIRYVEQIKSALEIDRELREPPIANESKKGVEGVCVPADIFPSWMRCLKCGYLHYKPWDDEKNFPITCQVCHKGSLEQMSWVLAHQDGHLAEVPWHYLTHQHGRLPEQKQCSSTWGAPYLIMKQEGARYKLRCSICNASATFEPRAPLAYTGNAQPWLRERTEPSETPAKILELNDTRVHFATTQNALVIPPESRVRVGTVVDRLYSSSEKLKRMHSAKTGLQKKQAIKQLCNEFQCSPEAIDFAVEEINRGYPLYGKQITPGLLLESEYKALTEPMPDLLDDEDFVPNHFTGSWHDLVAGLPVSTKPAKVGRLVDTVVSVARLKEIMVMKGFQRVNREGPLVPPDIDGGGDWFPALELFGEGVFFTLNESVLRGWERQDEAIKRATPFLRRYEGSGMNFDPSVAVSPRFLLLHALAHMLIKELESQAGYPAASLKERIYCDPGSETPMAGILIYVAVPDIVGSLGGLAELAEPKRLMGLLTRIFDHAEWCSMDPVCSEHEGQGPGLLNKAACHGCLLIPETCCAYGNVLLDRLFIKGDRPNGLRPILDFVAGEADGQA